MNLTKKQAKKYKRLILAKLSELGVKNEIGYTKLSSFRVARQVVEKEEGVFAFEKTKIPAHQASNLYKNLTKKLLKMPAEAIDKFLSTELTPPKSKDILIEKKESDE